MRTDLPARFPNSNPLVPFASLRLCARIALFLKPGEVGREGVYVYDLVDDHDHVDEKPKSADPPGWPPLDRIPREPHASTGRHDVR
jgi:hypothetical protein